MTVHEVERVLEDLWADLAPWPTADDLVAELDHMTSEAFRLAEKLHVAEAEVAAMRGSMTEATPPMWQLDDAGLLVELAAAQKAATVAHARWLAVLAEADRRGVVEREHHMPTNSWLAAGTSHSTRTARAEVRLAESLTRHEHVATALGEGRMSVEQAATIVVGLDRLPDDLDPVTRDAVEAQMVDYAGEFNPTALRRLVNQSLSRFLCKGSSCCCSNLEVAVDAFGVDEGELGQSLFPVRHDLSLDEPAGGLAFAGGLAGFLGAVTSAFVLDGADR